MMKLESDSYWPNQILFFKVLLGIAVATVFALTIFRDFDRDELEAVHTAWKILNGELIYIDFFQHHHPFFYYLIAPIIQLFGETTSTLIILRLLMFGFFLGMLWVSYRITKIVFNNEPASWLSTLLLTSVAMFSQKAIEIRPDVAQVFFALLAILLLFQYRKKPDHKLLYSSAFCIGVSFLFLQKTIFIIASLGLVQLFWVYEDRKFLKQVVVYWLCFGVTIFPYFLYLLLMDQFEVYLFWNWILNMNFTGSFSAINAIIDSFYYNHFVWIFYFIGTMILLNGKANELIFLSVLFLASVFFVQAPYRQYFMPFLPFMSAISAVTMLTLLSKMQMKVMVSVAVVVPIVFLIRTMIVYPNGPQLDKIQWVLNQSVSTDQVYDGDARFNLYRRDLDFFWYSTDPKKGGLRTYQGLKPYSYNVYTSIERYEPKIISNLFIDTSESIIESNYHKSDKYADLYVRNK